VKSGHYKLAKQIGRHGFFAEVAVNYYRVDDGPRITVADSVPPAVHRKLGAAAITGVKYALEHCDCSADFAATGITITEIIEQPVDTTTESVQFAASHATWIATGRAPTKEPKFNDGRIVFED